MTVAYSLDVATSGLFTQIKVLLRWKGSVWKSIWSELLIWLLLYSVLSVIYRVLLNKAQREVFEQLCTFFDTFSVFIPVTFMLGFYVSIVYNRWTKVFDNVGWIDTSALTIAQYIRGTSERSRLIRRNCIRYMIVAQAMVFRDVSPAIRRRFPTMRHLITAGLLTEDELVEFDAIVSPQSKYWQPIQWLFSLVTIAKDEGLIADYYLYVDLMDKLRDFRTKILNLVIFDMVPIPLVYTQVVNLAVRTYFLLALFGRQFLENSANIPGAKWKIDIYFPIMTSLQIVFIIGWLKVSEVMLNPLGEDDEDFETNWIIERNLQVGYAVVDQAYGRFPIIKRDPFWEDETPQTLDTPTSTRKPHTHMQGSCINMNEADLDNGLISFVRRRSRSIGDDDSSSIYTENTDKRASTASMLPRHMWAQPRSKISNAIAKFYKSDPEPRRASVCVAALDLNHRRPSTDLREIEKPENVDDVIIDVPALVQERIRIAKQQAAAVKIEIPEASISGTSEATSPSGNVKWFVEEMPVIEEEDEKTHRKTPRNLSASSFGSRNPGGGGSGST
ncbi:hypothetical protein GCK72_007925 [Caenorhabditis remanei]|uniref:Bestrophin homolog n=1 Tax=Caenorhabditis remanei TaxID=31234 RepID=A0A6A5HKB7_CAERE|nr:hypothetical protein GCK72_007925 [Caenorhabditis remanei]KAF1767965.1 hypothetical protein GCK72_007925 [Caenorhabditis remanei]